MKSITYIVLFLSTFLGGAQNEDLFEKANAFYNEGKYAEAIDNYQTILESGHHSPDIYFNLGNANYKLNNIAPSIYFYEKALMLNPKDKDIKNNMAFAKNMTIDVIDVIPEAGLSKVLKSIANSMSFDSWSVISVIMVFSFVVLFLLYYFSYSTLRKRFAFISSLVALLLVCLTLAFAFHKYNLDKFDNPAIVFVQESKVKNTPNPNGEEAFRLHEGTKVQVIESYNNWQKIKLTDGKIGWVMSEDVKLLKDF